MNENNWKSRWSKDQIKAMLLEQQQAFWQVNTGIERTQLAELERVMPLPHSVLASQSFCVLDKNTPLYNDAAAFGIEGREHHLYWRQGRNTYPERLKRYEELAAVLQHGAAWAVQRGRTRSA